VVAEIDKRWPVKGGNGGTCSLDDVVLQVAESAQKQEHVTEAQK
jgi:hypothetical protein